MSSDGSTIETESEFYVNDVPVYIANKSGNVLFSNLKGTGEAKKIIPVKFENAFKKSPKHVALSVITVDGDSNFNLRYTITYEKLTNSGFNIIAYTQSDTVISSLRVHWHIISQ